MGVSHKDTASQQRNAGRDSKDQRGSAQTMRFGYKQVIPVLAAGAAAVAIAAAPTAMAEPATVQQPSTTTPVAGDDGSHGGGGHGGGPVHRYEGNCQASPLYGQVGQVCR